MNVPRLRRAVALAGALSLTLTAAGALPSAAGAFPGYQRVQSAPIPVASGTTQEGTVACPPGTVQLGGGAAFTGGIPAAGQNINSSAPISGGWFARFNNANARSADLRVDAICAARPKGYTEVITQVTSPANVLTSARAVCPAGKVVLGGGASTSAASVTATLTSAWPAFQTRYRASLWNGSGRDAQLTVYALCARKPAGYTIVSATGHGRGPAVQVGAAQCPDGTALLGGGVEVAQAQPAITLGASLDEPATQWLTEVINLTSASADITTYAICAT
jgi:hypothetical protein